MCMPMKAPRAAATPAPVLPTDAFNAQLDAQMGKTGPITSDNPLLTTSQCKDLKAFNTKKATPAPATESVGAQLLQ